MPSIRGARDRGFATNLIFQKERTMDRRTALSAISACLLLSGLALSAGEAAAQGAKNLVGTWSVVINDNIDASGKRTPTFGPDLKGLLIFTADGRYSVMFARSNLQKFASNNRLKGTPEENQAVLAGSLAHFGKYTVDDSDKTFTFHVEASTYPNWVGTSQKRPYTISGDELRYGNAAATGGGRAELVFKRAR
jgi:Lipocalin-like domain